MQDIEIEVKFHLPEVKLLRQGILALGGQSAGRVFESNYRFDTPGQDLKRQAALLRLRRDSRCTLTYKASLQTTEKEFKARRDLEVEVSDFDTMNRMIEALGHKIREGQSVVCGDLVPQDRGQ